MVKPWLWLKPQKAHDLSQQLLPLYAKVFGSSVTPNVAPLPWRHLIFKNRMGIAGGVDKSGKNLLAWQAMGAGFLELGTVTPEPQGPNPGQIIDRDLSKHSLWNKMGFPNPGSAEVSSHLKSIRNKIRVPLLVNIGKNRNTPQEKAGDDYAKLFTDFENDADIFVINISSPNTKGLRDLLKPDSLKIFLKTAFADKSPEKPWLLKLSPDILDEELYRIIDLSCEHNCSGFTLTNTLQNNPEYYPKHDGGGVSGRPLKQRSEKLLQNAAEYLTNQGMSDSLIISVGGIENADDVKRRLNMGAKLVQTYSALVFEGPQFFRRSLKEFNWQSEEKNDLNGYPSLPVS